MPRKTFRIGTSHTRGENCPLLRPRNGLQPSLDKLPLRNSQWLDRRVKWTREHVLDQTVQYLGSAAALQWLAAHFCTAVCICNRPRLLPGQSKVCQADIRSIIDALKRFGGEKCSALCLV